MKNLKKERRITTQVPKSSRFKRFCLLASTLATFLGYGCSTSKAEVGKPKVGAASSSQSAQNSDKMRCYDYKEKEMKVYIEKSAKSDQEIGMEIPLHFSKLEIKDEKNNSVPLAFFCTHDGHIFWITAEAVYIRRITLLNDKLEVKKILEAKHTEPDEYAVSGVKVVSADIWRKPDESWQNITVATLTNTGLLQASRYSLEDMAKSDAKRGILDLARKLKKENRWPEKGIVGGVIGVLDGDKFSAIPIGERHRGNVRNYYYIVLEGDDGAPFEKRDFGVRTLKLSGDHPGLKNVFGITKPIRYDRKLGGWVVNLIGERKDGKVVHIFPVLTP